MPSPGFVVVCPGADDEVDAWAAASPSPLLLAARCSAMRFRQAAISGAFSSCGARNRFRAVWMSSSSSPSSASSCSCACRRLRRSASAVIVRSSCINDRWTIASASAIALRFATASSVSSTMSSSMGASAKLALVPIPVLEAGGVMLVDDASVATLSIGRRVAPDPAALDLRRLRVMFPASTFSAFPRLPSRVRPPAAAGGGGDCRTRGTTTVSPFFGLTCVGADARPGRWLCGRGVVSPPFPP
mmetsp:Transcript_2490/g.7730  ORF Transcript_2490/g.7730 Transcript_2490/m.7730 type:complete len:244 (+) Transcript_2490:293-1024(+)